MYSGHVMPSMHAFNTNFVWFFRSNKCLQIQVSGVIDEVSGYTNSVNFNFFFFYSLEYH